MRGLVYHCVVLGRRPVQLLLTAVGTAVSTWHTLITNKYVSYFHCIMSHVITSPAGAVAKYCDEHVCVCVCVFVSVHEDIFGTTHVIFSKLLCSLPMAVARSYSDWVTKSQEEGAVLRFSSPLTMRCTAQHLGPMQRRLNRSRCRLGWWVSLAQGTVYYVGWRSPKGKGHFWEKNMCPTSLTLLIIANWTGPCPGTRQGRRFIASVGRVHYRPRSDEKVHRAKQAGNHGDTDCVRVSTREINYSVCTALVLMQHCA